MTNKFKRKCLQKFYVSSEQEKEWYRKTSYLEQPSRHFCQHFMRRATQQTLLAINLANQQKTTKLYFSSQIRKQFKLLAVPFKPLRCFLRNHKLVNCHVWYSFYYILKRSAVNRTKTMKWNNVSRWNMQRNQSKRRTSREQEVLGEYHLTCFYTVLAYCHIKTKDT